MKKKERTFKYFSFNGNFWSICLGIFLGIIVLTFAIDNGFALTPGQRNMESFIQEQYNFIEDECVERDWYCDPCTLESCPPCIENAGECTQYCHIEKTYIGEECETIEGFSNGLPVYNVTCIPGDLVDVCKFYPGKSKFDLVITDVLCKKGMYAREGTGFDCTYFISIYNKTTCEPVYEEQTYGCQDGDVVREARGLIE